MIVIPDLNSLEDATLETESAKKYATLEDPRTAYTAVGKHHRWYAQVTYQTDIDQFKSLAILIATVVRPAQIHADHH